MILAPLLLADLAFEKEIVGQFPVSEYQCLTQGLTVPGTELQPGDERYI